jgi:arylsulfatase A-like enzyme
MIKAFIAIAFLIVTACCSGPGTGLPPISADHPIHLEEYISQARIEESPLPEKMVESVEWRFDKPQPDWKPAVSPGTALKPLRTAQLGDSLRLILDEPVKSPGTASTRYSGGIWTDLPDWRREDWAFLVVSARAEGQGGTVTLAGNLNRRKNPEEPKEPPLLDSTESVDIIADGQVHSYALRLDRATGEYPGYEKWRDPWTDLEISFGADKRATIDLISISVIPKESKYAESPVGVVTEARGTAYRRCLFMHAPGRLVFSIRVPRSGRLDVAFGVLRIIPPVTFKVTVKAGKADSVVLLEEKYADITGWGQRSVDLNRFAGKIVRLTLEAESERPGTIALWAAPTVSGARSGTRPNVILYVIDGASADRMSIYGYNRRTTPNLERLAAEGAVFEHAYSNSSWTKISVPSFMTSLHSSVLGPLKGTSDRLPIQAVTMAEHMHRAGYQTAVIASNPYCGVMSGLDRGADVLREAGVQPNSRSSEVLHAEFWRWRADYPGVPYWVHFQTTDVHIPWTQSPPFAGLFIDPELQKTFREWLAGLGETEGSLDERFEKAGIDPERYRYLSQGFYDEAMASQDDRLGRLVRRLKAEGEWDRTLFILTADHGSSAAGIMPLDKTGIRQGQLNLASEVSHIPMVLIWPGRIKPGQRFEQPVSLIDLLPTILDLAGLPAPDKAQGRSFAPLILGKDDWEQRPVILDEFNVRPDTGEAYGTIGVIDGRWGALLKIEFAFDGQGRGSDSFRSDRLLIYDLWNDPQCLRSLHEGRPSLVKKYTEFLEDKFIEHQALAKKFHREDDVPLNEEQIQTLRSLGYIR